MTKAPVQTNPAMSAARTGVEGGAAVAGDDPFYVHVNN